MIQIIKIGTNCLFNANGEINYGLLRQKAYEIEQSNIGNVVVVSGAIGLGMQAEHETRKKSEISDTELLGYASLGQRILMDVYAKSFTKNVAQLLVTEQELTQNTHINDLIRENRLRGRITLVNYNDAVDFKQLKLDNDTLAAQIGVYCGAQRVVILGDYEGFQNNGTLIERLSEVTAEHYLLCKEASKRGRGGFETKLDAAKIMLEANKELIVGNINYHLDDLVEGRVKRTLFKG